MLLAHAALDAVDRLGKWWGAFRGVPPLAIWPVLIAAVLCTHTGVLIAPLLIGGLVIAYGARSPAWGSPWPPGCPGWGRPSA
ncbi:MAG: hypothetical protein U0790_11725 [Isosphaeraceae bacterium]